jgi:hypothetical protein
MLGFSSCHFSNDKRHPRLSFYPYLKISDLGFRQKLELHLKCFISMVAICGAINAIINGLGEVKGY